MSFCKSVERGRSAQLYTSKLTVDADVSGDGAIHIGLVVEGQAGVWTTLVLADGVQLQHWTCPVYKLPSESPQKLGRRIGLS